MRLREAIAENRVAAVIVAFMAVVAVGLVGASLGAPDVTTYAPTPRDPVEVGDDRVGPQVMTIDASSPDQWRYFDFSRGSVVENPGPLEWDIAFRRFRIMTNGGAGFPGQAGVSPLGEVAFDSIVATPTEGYVDSEHAADSVNPTLERWYRYSFTSHLLMPKQIVYAVRTADGRYAKIEIIGYYCDGARPGCVTFRYVYAGGGGTDVQG